MWAGFYNLNYTEDLNGRGQLGELVIDEGNVILLRWGETVSHSVELKPLTGPLSILQMIH
jgi:hypothetical protein